MPSPGGEQGGRCLAAPARSGSRDSASRVLRSQGAARLARCLGCACAERRRDARGGAHACRPIQQHPARRTWRPARSRERQRPGACWFRAGRHSASGSRDSASAANGVSTDAGAVTALRLKPVAAPVQPLCSVTGSAAGLKVCRRPRPAGVLPHCGDPTVRAGAVRRRPFREPARGPAGRPASTMPLARNLPARRREESRLPRVRERCRRRRDARALVKGGAPEFEARTAQVPHVRQRRRHSAALLLRPPHACCALKMQAPTCLLPRAPSGKSIATSRPSLRTTDPGTRGLIKARIRSWRNPRARSAWVIDPGRMAPPARSHRLHAVNGNRWRAPRSRGSSTRGRVAMS